MNPELISSGRIVFFLLILLFIITGTMLCFWGYKYFRLIMFGIVCGAICFLGYRLSERLTGNLVIRLILCVAVSFMGICLAYFTYIIIAFLMEKTRIRKMAAQRAYMISAVLGAVVLALTVYYGIYHSRMAAVMTALVCGGGGFVVQRRNKEKQVRFKTYDDLMKLKPLKESGEDKSAGCK